jgi:hypothetical protein
MSTGKADMKQRIKRQKSVELMFKLLDQINSGGFVAYVQLINEYPD